MIDWIAYAKFLHETYNDDAIDSIMKELLSEMGLED